MTATNTTECTCSSINQNYRNLEQRNTYGCKILRIYFVDFPVNTNLLFTLILAAYQRMYRKFINFCLIKYLLQTL